MISDLIQFSKIHIAGCVSYDLYSFVRNFDDVEQEVTLRIGKYEKSNFIIDYMEDSTRPTMVSFNGFGRN